MSERPPSGRRAPLGSVSAPCPSSSSRNLHVCADGAQPHAALPAFLQKMGLAFPQQVLCGVGTPEAGSAPSPCRVLILSAQTTEWSFQQGMEPGRRASCWPRPRPSRLPRGDPRLPLAAASWPGPGPGSTAARAAVNEEELGAEQDARAASRGQKSCAFNSTQGRGETGLCRKCLALCPTPEAPSTCCSGEDEMRLQQEMGPKTDRHGDGLHPTLCVRALRCV